MKVGPQLTALLSPPIHHPCYTVYTRSLSIDNCNSELGIAPISCANATTDRGITYLIQKKPQGWGYPLNVSLTHTLHNNLISNLLRCSFGFLTRSTLCFSYWEVYPLLPHTYQRYWITLFYCEVNLITYLLLKGWPGCSEWGLCQSQLCTWKKTVRWT